MSNQDNNTPDPKDFKRGGPYDGKKQQEEKEAQHPTDYTGFSGGTGASGLGGAVGKAIGSILDMNESVEAFAKKVAYAGLSGATGGTGGTGATGAEGNAGSLDEAIKNDESLAVVSKKYSDKIDNTSDPDVILHDFQECQTTLDFVLNKTNSVTAFFAYLQGKRLLKLQGIRTQQNNRDWISWISKKLPTLKKRSREKYMSLASVPGVEYYFEYGSERLAEFGIYFSILSDEDKAAMGAKPFEVFMKDFGISSESSYEERREHIDAELEVKKLKRIGVIFPHDEMVSFLRVQDPLTGEERKHLKNLYQIDPQKPVELLNLIIAKELKRKNFIAGTDTPPSSPSEAEANTQDPPAANGPNTPVTGPNIDKLVVTLCKSLEPVATMGTKVDGTYDRKALIQLKSYIDMLLLDTPQENPDAD